MNMTDEEWKSIAQKETVTVADIQRFSVHDGPGIRTTVFLKGCPLRCRWCHNPETHDPRPQVRVTPARCIGCGACAAVCPRHCHTLTQDAHEFHSHLCIRCNACVDACPVKAIDLCGREMTAEQIVAQAEKDVAFYRGIGGITLSGGEPMLHTQQAMEIFSLAKQRGLNTCVETCGHFELEPVLDPFCALIDHIFWDVKFLDAEKHREYCGVDNELILHNLKCAAQRRKDIVVRTVIMRGISDSEEHVRPIAEFVRSLGLENPPVLLAFHPFGSSKGEAVGLDETYMGKEYIPEESTLAHLREIVRQ